MGRWYRRRPDRQRIDGGHAVALKAEAGARGRDSELAFDFILSARRSRPFEGLAAFLTSNLVVLAKCIPTSNGQEINMLAFDHRAVSLVKNSVALCSSAEN
jgi:hypothetical protein